jgi:hypothetical protein
VIIDIARKKAERTRIGEEHCAGLRIDFQTGKRKREGDLPMLKQAMNSRCTNHAKQLSTRASW